LRPMAPPFPSRTMRAEDCPLKKSSDALPGSMLNPALTNPGGPGVVVVWMGENVRGRNAEDGLVPWPIGGKGKAGLRGRTWVRRLICVVVDKELSAPGVFCVSFGGAAGNWVGDGKVRLLGGRGGGRL